MELIDLARDSASFEFSLHEAAHVREAMLAVFGPYTKSDPAEGVTLDFGGEKFILLADSDEPCLIATSAAGVRMLHMLASKLGVAARAITARTRRQFDARVAQAVDELFKHPPAKIRSPSAKPAGVLVASNQK